MPDLAMHYYFGQAVKDALPDKIHIEKDAFDFALSGPDDWFYCFTNKALGMRAPVMHRQKTGAFLRVLAQSKSLFSYFAGFFCHYILDATCHPYIIVSTGMYDHTNNTRQYRGNHTAFERALDRWILKDHMQKHPLTDVMFDMPLPQELRRPIDQAYYEVYGWENVFTDLLDAKRKMRKYLRILEDPHGTARLITDLIPHPLLRPLPYSRHYYESADILNLEHRTWHHPKDVRLTSSESVPDLMKRAGREAVKAISAAYEGDLSLIGNRSYITGFEMDDERNNAEDIYLLLEK